MQEEWRIVFFLSGALVVFSALVYIVLAEDGITEWARDRGDSQKPDLVGNTTQKVTSDKEFKPLESSEEIVNVHL